MERQAAEERAAAAAYFDAVTESERCWKLWLKAETDVHGKAEAWRVLNPKGADKLIPLPRTKRISCYMSDGLKALPGATSGRYGGFVLQNYFPQQGAPWLEGERRELGEQET